MKLCIFCKNCQFEAPYNYSSMTCGDGSITCMYREEWSAPLWEQEEYAKWVKFAEKCKHYEEAK